MEVIVLGSGTFVPELERNCPAYLLINRENKVILDFGRGTLHQLIKLKQNLYEVNNIFISHTHADHCSELSSFIQFILDAPDKKELKDKYSIYGPVGIKNVVGYLMKAFNLKNHKYADRIKVREMAEGEIVKLNGFEIRAFLVEHSTDINCFAYRIKTDNKVICYSGDSPDCEGLRNACANVDLGIVEATLPVKIRPKGHLSGEELGKLAFEINIKKLLVTHVANSYLFAVKKDIMKNYSGLTLVAKDLMKIRIN